MHGVDPSAKIGDLPEKVIAGGFDTGTEAGMIGTNQWLLRWLF